MHKTKENQAFTLIELLVVISVIALLASIILAALSAGRAKARDAKRVADLGQLQKALELYYSSQQPNTYPVEGCSSGFAGNQNNPTDYLSCWLDLQTKLQPYIKKLPLDPKDDNSGSYPTPYWYQARNSGQGYLLLMVPDDSSWKSKDDGCYASPYYCKGQNWQ